MTDPRVTFAELQAWPDDGRRYELYDGEAIVVPSPFPRHQRVVKHVGDVLQPDLVYFREERRHVVHERQCSSREVSAQQFS